MNVSVQLATLVSATLGISALMVNNYLTTGYAQHPPVSRDAIIVDTKLRPETGEIGYIFEWVNDYECRFLAAGAAQNVYVAPEQLQTQIAVDFGESEGPRGKGTHRNLHYWWFKMPTRPFHGTDVTFTAWHRCGDQQVMSEMFVIPIDQFFEGLI